MKDDHWFNQNTPTDIYTQKPRVYKLLL